MTQTERLDYLIAWLLNERGDKAAIPTDLAGKKCLLRALFNVRPPGAAPAEFLEVQDAYLQKEIRDPVKIPDLNESSDGIYLWRGDITRMAADAIVNAANSALLGCFLPNHNCIDNAIHTAAGIQLRQECAKLMAGRHEPTGRAKITSGWNLPAKHVIHTVGPIVDGELTGEHCRLLASCYNSCLELAAANDLSSIAFCCISTGVFRFPNEKAAEIAVQTCGNFKRNRDSQIKIIFNVFKEEDQAIYERLLA